MHLFNNVLEQNVLFEKQQYPDVTISLYYNNTTFYIVHCTSYIKSGQNFI